MSDGDTLYRFLRDFFNNSYPWDTWRGFIPYSIRAVLIGFALVLLILPFWKEDLLSINISRWWIIFFTPIFVYWVTFFLRRLWLTIYFSKKINIVLAYNLEGKSEDYIKRYNSFVFDLKNKINEYSLGKKVRIIVRPLDTKFKEYILAEKKTQLGLPGSTLLIWGYVAQKKGKTAFRTLFSYEFSYPKSISKNEAKKIFSKKVEKGLNRGLFGLGSFRLEIDEDIFSHHTFSASLFILGLMAASFGQTKRAIELFENFIKIFDEADLMRRVSMREAIEIVKEELEKCHLQAAKIYLNNRKYGECQVHINRVLKVNPNSYTGNLFKAFYSEKIEGNREGAIDFNERARRCRGRGDYHCIFNDAYFALSDGLYEEAIEFYDIIPEATSLDPRYSHELLSICEFLNDKFKETGDPAFLFGEGLITRKWINNKEGIKVLREFIREAENLDYMKYNTLITKAQQLRGIIKIANRF